MPDHAVSYRNMKDLGLWTREAVEPFNWGSMAHSNMSLKTVVQRECETCSLSSRGLGGE